MSKFFLPVYLILCLTVFSMAAISVQTILKRLDATPVMEIESELVSFKKQKSKRPIYGVYAYVVRTQNQ